MPVRTSSTAIGRLMLLGCGVFLACGLGRLRPLLDVPFRGPRPVAFWVADRDAQEIVGLDEQLYPTWSVELPWPSALASCRDGGLWATSALEGTPDGDHALVRLDDRGDVLASIRLTPWGVPLDLSAIDGEEALLVLQGAGPAALSIVTRDGALSTLCTEDGLRVACGRGTRVLVGSANGRLRLLRRLPGRARTEALGELGVQIRDVALGPRAGTWWVLRGGEQPRVDLVDARLVTLHSAACDLSAPGFVAVPGEQRVWLTDERDRAVLRVDPGGSVAPLRRRLPLPGVASGLAWSEGLLLLSGGAVIRLDADGHLQPGQGGFRALVDVAARSGEP